VIVFFAAARLYREGKAPVLILSGGNIDWLSNNALNTMPIKWQICFLSLGVLLPP
jgi:uncharacterized SAM-binding protein YcdF (DUF218 family)